MAEYGCGHHRALIYTRGATQLLGEVFPALSVKWNRIRDDISGAQVIVGVSGCCDFLATLETVAMELHIIRDDDEVWEGVITRLEYERHQVTIIAEDLLWVAKRTALVPGYSNAYPNIGYVLDRMDWLMREQTYAKYGDPWNMVAHLHKVESAGGPKTSKVVPAWNLTTWEDFDKFAEDSGSDYTMVNRELYYWDLNYAWVVLPNLEEEHLGEGMRIVEYGNELATRLAVTNNNGYAGITVAGPDNIAKYGYVDVVMSDFHAVEGDGNVVPTAEELKEMTRTSERQLTSRAVPPVSIVVPANSTLLPSSPWRVNDLIPGAWFDVVSKSLCRKVTETQRLHEVVVTEDATKGETVAITVVSAPSSRIDVDELGVVG